MPHGRDDALKVETEQSVAERFAEARRTTGFAANLSIGANVVGGNAAPLLPRHSQPSWEARSSALPLTAKYKQAQSLIWGGSFDPGIDVLELAREHEKFAEALNQQLRAMLGPGLLFDGSFQ